MKKLVIGLLAANALFLAVRAIQDAYAMAPRGGGGATCSSLPGDTNGDGRADLSDAVYILTHLFLGGPAPVAHCQEGGGCNLEKAACDRARLFFQTDDAAVQGSFSVGSRITLKPTESGTDGGEIKVRDASGRITVDIDGELEGGGSSLSMFNGAGTLTVAVDADQTDSASMELRKADGTTGILLDADNSIGGSVVVTQILRITGGSDMAEPFDFGGVSPEPGHVVAIDPDHPGKLRLASRPYDTGVAGVVSGAGGVRPGLLMSQAGTSADGTLPVALSGRVHVWCDASHGAIRPGDLLVTSSTPGHAMRAEPGRAAGATVGKAMTPLASGRGLVLALVSLQ